MKQWRVESHPILDIPERAVIPFSWCGWPLPALAGDTIASALFAHGERIFGRHPKDGSPQGIFCANGQCAQCMVLANGRPVKACMTHIQPGIVIEPLDGLPVLPPAKSAQAFTPIRTVSVECLIVGGGPAGLAAAIELGQHNVQTLLVDDKDRLGGKLVLQTHRFFGSARECYAGTRGIDIATNLANELSVYASVTTWLNSTVTAVFSDHKVGVVRNDKKYLLVEPQVLLVAAGAREKSLAFKGNTLPGVYGAGAFQTLLNRDLVRPSQRLFIVGGGNIGLITGYHALQAGIEVVGLVEALPECGGYKVHRDKLARIGVPIYTTHTILSANGVDGVESVTIAQVDSRFRPIPGTERSLTCDTILIAVGLDSVNEFYQKAQTFGMTTFAAGDADEIAEASAAMFSGKIQGREIARALGRDVPPVPEAWLHTIEVLKSRPGRVREETVPRNGAVFPVMHCCQEIPCNPCTAVCPQGAIFVSEEDIRHTPDYIAPQLGTACTACEKCVNICPGLAITLVDMRPSRSVTLAKDEALVTIPYEFDKETLRVGEMITAVDTTGAVLGEVEVVRLRSGRATNRTVLVKVRAPQKIATRIAGIRIQPESAGEPLDHYVARLTDDLIVCRCERVTLAEIKAAIRTGVRDMNEMKALTRAGMGACGSKTCAALVRRAFAELGIAPDEVTENVIRPLFVEVSLGVLAGVTVEAKDGP